MQINDGGPAYPTDLDNYGPKYSSPGMSLRDVMATHAMGAMISSREYVEGIWRQDDIAKQAYQMADAMIRARSQGEKNGE